ncbi:tetratricopeptide repeat protein [Burkholderia sp. Ac-20365]|uniref:tetratricopeptide repeat protein n=1 Tax=Burkholderia sp. Ac-20365 TaxID=2703897 RepID=UPI00197C8EA6|nr:tetratricopeptide repeat protein [Burkholderia sp. Ac-20365]MBN3759967.1 tetratricopeptide repeat protein [Burkholderia sp. Ac-20365]
MLKTPLDLHQVSLDSFQTFLRHAVAARQQADTKAHDIWVQAASHLFPTDTHSLDTLVQQLIERQLRSEAETIARALAALDPHDANALFRLGYTLQATNRHQDAIAPYREALAIDPSLHSLRNNLAGALMTADPASAEAAELLQAALDQNPDDANAWVNIAKLHLARFDLDSALEAERRALALQPDNPIMLGNHGQTLREAQQWEQAERFTLAAHRAAPDVASHLSNLSMIHLLRGNYADGWREHEARWDGSKELAGRRPVLPRPAWRGEPLAGKTLLLWGEQGMGDLLQFCRYVPLLADRVHREGGRLAWNSFPQMGALLERSLAQHADEFTPGGGVDELPAFDYEISLLSLPLLFDTREETIPSAVPYLQADPQAVDTWRQRLAGEKRLKVGLAWTGSHGHQRNPFRRVGLERYVDAFLKLDNVAFYSLQPGAAADVAAARAAGFDIADHTAGFQSFDDTAAYMSALDLVITVCTSVAHLSGAIGQRTWVLLDVNPHWVWLLDRADSPWYPDATLYRQKQFAQWQPVFDALTRDLAALAGSHRRRQK